MDNMLIDMHTCKRSGVQTTQGYWSLFHFTLSFGTHKYCFELT